MEPENRLAEALAVIAYERPAEPWRVAHDALKGTSRPLATEPQDDARALLVEAVAEAEAAADAIEGRTTDLDEAICCSGHMCGCRGSSNRDLLVHELRGIIARIDAYLERNP